MALGDGKKALCFSYSHFFNSLLRADSRRALPLPYKPLFWGGGRVHTWHVEVPQPVIEPTP